MLFFRCFLLFVFSSFIGLNSWATEDESVVHSEKTSVWKVSKGDYNFFLAGTMHVLKAEDYPLPAAFDVAYQQVDTIFVETDTGRVDMDDFQKKLQKKSQYEQDQNLFSLLNDKANKALVAYCEKRHIPVAVFSSMRVGLVVASISMAELGLMGIDQRGVDEHYLTLARKHQKTIHSLESVDQQIRFLVDMGKGKESEFLLQSLNEINEMSKDINLLRKAWREGDTELMNTLMIEDMQQQYPQIYNQLLRQRNLNWMPTLMALPQQNLKTMVLVGAAHIAGKDGLLVLLKEAGFSVEQM